MKATHWEALRIVDDVMSTVRANFDVMDIAEDEIELAQAKYGEAPPQRDEFGRLIGEKGPLWRSFAILKPTFPLVYPEFVYRAHFREMLDRVAFSQDTRPATDVEIVVMMRRISLAVPMHSEGLELYWRLFQRRFPTLARQVLSTVEIHLDDHERIHGDHIDDHEAHARRKFTHPWRVVKDD